jgi:hypothetical protein
MDFEAATFRSPAEEQRASMCPKASLRPIIRIGGPCGNIGLRIARAIEPPDRQMLPA